MLHEIILKAINRMTDQMQIEVSETEVPLEIRTEKAAKQSLKEKSSLSAFESIYKMITDNLEAYEKMEIHIIKE